MFRLNGIADRCATKYSPASSSGASASSASSLASSLTPGAQLYRVPNGFLNIFDWPSDPRLRVIEQLCLCRIRRETSLSRDYSDSGLLSVCYLGGASSNRVGCERMLTSLMNRHPGPVKSRLISLSTRHAPTVMADSPDTQASVQPGGDLFTRLAEKLIRGSTFVHCCGIASVVFGQLLQARNTCLTPVYEVDNVPERESTAESFGSDQLLVAASDEAASRVLWRNVSALQRLELKRRQYGRSAGKAFNPAGRGLVDPVLSLCQCDDTATIAADCILPNEEKLSTAAHSVTLTSDASSTVTSVVLVIGFCTGETIRTLESLPLPALPEDTRSAPSAPVVCTEAVEASRRRVPRRPGCRVRLPRLRQAVRVAECQLHLEGDQSDGCFWDEAFSCNYAHCSRLLEAPDHHEAHKSSVIIVVVPLLVKNEPPYVLLRCDAGGFDEMVTYL